jgi:hypothetical protein
VLIVVRPKLTKNFVQMANETVFDGRLSRLARQLLTEIMARPPGWQSTADQMADDGKRERGARAESRRSIHAAFAELETFGYLIRTRSRIPKGQPGAGGFMTTLTFYGLPQNGHNQDGSYEGVGRWTPS